MIFVSVSIAALLIIIGVLIARLHQQHERTLSLKATIFALDETVTDLEAKLKPFEWRIPDTEMQSTVTRGHSHSPPRRESVTPRGELIMIDIDDLPNLEGDNHE